MKRFCLALLITLNSQNLLAESRLKISNFGENSLSGWQQKRFKGETRYQLIELEGRRVLRADSQNSGSGLFKEQHIDLQKTPFLNWSWRIGNRLLGLNEQDKAGDDYAARVYVVIQGGLAFWQTKAVNYVWASTSAKNTIWPNAFAGDHAMMLALRGPEAALNVWQNEKRNVRADLKQLLGEDILYIDAVALMTDTDNHHGQVTAFYGDIWFSGE